VSGSSSFPLREGHVVENQGINGLVKVLCATRIARLALFDVKEKMCATAADAKLVSAAKELDLRSSSNRRLLFCVIKKLSLERKQPLSSSKTSEYYEYSVDEPSARSSPSTASNIFA
jgi:hypothetical protein